MITTRNIKAFAGGITNIKDRAAHLVQGMEGCPIEDTLKALVSFDRANSPGAKSPSAKRWIRQFCGFESADSGKGMDAIIQLVQNGEVVDSKDRLNDLLRGLANDV